MKQSVNGKKVPSLREAERHFPLPGEKFFLWRLTFRNIYMLLSDTWILILLRPRENDT